jgi:hypothetical protein
MWDFIASFSSNASKSMKKRISIWIRDDLTWWNRLLSNFNDVFFFDIENKVIFYIYTNACLIELEEIVSATESFKSKNISQSNAFRTRFDLNKLSINVHEVKIILLVFQLWVSSLIRQKIKIYTNNTLVFSRLSRSIVKSLANAFLRKIFFLIAKWDIVIKCQWISDKIN